MISLGIELFGKDQNALGTIFNAKTATLAAFFDDVQLTPGYFELVDV